MARPRSAEGSKRALAEAAAALFADRGFHATKVSDIVAAAGLTQAAFYLYYPSKDALYQELIDGYFADVRRVLADGALPPGLDHPSLVAAMEATVLASFQVALAYPDLTRMVMASDLAEPLLREAARSMAGHVRSAQAAGYVRPGLSAELWAECLNGAMVRLLHRYLLSGERSPEELAAEAVRTLAYGSLGQPPEPSKEPPPKETPA
ncbi:MAG: TetR/AcrR family transcriptional regulator [Dehalococcoidia bacterium]